MWGVDVMVAAAQATIPPVKPWYKILYIQVLIAILIAVVVGWLWPDFATTDWIKALGYFEVVSSFALVVGLVMGNLIQVGHGLAAKPDAAAVASYVSQAKAQKSVDFVLNIIPDSVGGA